MVNNEKEFQKKLIDFEVSRWDSKEIRESVISRYSEDIVLGEYENLFRTLVAKRKVIH